MFYLQQNQNINMIDYLDLDKGFITSLVINISHACIASLKVDLKSYSKLAKFNSTFYCVILTLPTKSAVWKNICVVCCAVWLWYLLPSISSTLPNPISLHWQG